MARLPSMDSLYVFAVAARYVSFTAAAAELAPQAEAVHQLAVRERLQQLTLRLIRLRGGGLGRISLPICCVCGASISSTLIAACFSRSGAHQAYEQPPWSIIPSPQDISLEFFRHSRE
jgi:hypothetical protein